MTVDLSPVIHAAKRANPPEAGDYVRDGLLICGKCHTPKQCRITLYGQVKTMPCLCKCASDRLEAEEQARRAQDRLDYIRRLRVQGIRDKAALNCTFASDKGINTALMDKARRYVTAWERMQRENIGVIFWGNTGTGKTFAAGCIANELISKGVPVLMTSFPRILSGLTGTYADDRLNYMDSLRHFDLLVIDDLGAERQSGFALESVYSVIDARAKTGKPLIVTTNLSLAELKNPKDISCQRIYDRVLEMCVPIRAVGQSLRRLSADEKMKQAKELLEGA